MRLFIFALFFIVHLEAASFHAILVGDSQDESAGEAIVKDLAMMQKIVTEMADLSGLNLQLALFEGGRESLLESLKKHFQQSFSLAQGGLFTLKFIKTLRDAGQGLLQANWEVILHRTTCLTKETASKKIGEEQTPQFAWIY